MGTPFDLFAYGFLMAVLGLAAAQFAPGLYWLFLTAGGLGGAFGLFWGLWGLRQSRYPGWATLSLAIFSLLLGGLNVLVWQAWLTNESGVRLALMLTGLMLFFSIAQLVLLWQEHRAPPP
jgi:hypothetical protein